jgi:hypothetical protein
MIFFPVAYKRFADNVPLAIDHELVRGVERGILSIMNAGLGINGPDGLRICKELKKGLVFLTVGRMLFLPNSKFHGYRLDLLQGFKACGSCFSDRVFYISTKCSHSDQALQSALMTRRLASAELAWVESISMSGVCSLCLILSHYSHLSSFSFLRTADQLYDAEDL